GWGWSVDNLFIQQAPTGIEQETFIANMEVFPNPTTGKLKIQFGLKESTSLSVDILDAKGNSIQRNDGAYLSAGNHEKEIDLSGESTGVYFIKLKTDKGSRISKVILSK